MEDEKKTRDGEAAPDENQDAPEAEREETTVAEEACDWLRSIIPAVAVVVLLFTFCVRLVTVKGPSMQSTLYTGDMLVTLSSVFADFKAGDIVVVNDYNAELSETIIKRIVAVGGQTVDIDFTRGEVYVDGSVLEEPYIKEPTFTPEGFPLPVTLKENEVFIMGDNRNHSTDSRSDLLGPVDVGYIQGKALFLLFPGRSADTNQRDFGRIGPLRYSQHS